MIYKIKRLLKKYLPEILFKWLKKKQFTSNFYQNINLNLNNLKQKKILISYITTPLEKDIRTWYIHTNLYECMQLIKIFINHDFAIDLIDCRNLSINLDKQYDIIFGFGEPYYKAAIKNPQAKKIIYLTELHPDFSYKQEKQRIEYFYERHKRKVSITRSYNHYKKKYIDIADYGILMGNNYTEKVFPELAGRLFTIYPTGHINKDYIYTERNYNKTRKNFVWFGSLGAVHKGLDILIDVFNTTPECNLFICGLDAREERLFSINKKNIINLGYINVNSDQFINLMNTSGFVILPSCSEGMSTAVLTCMNHGLIPIITRETGIDIFEFGYYLLDYKVEYIKEMVISYSKIDEDTLKTYHKKVFDYSRSNFNLKRFSEKIEYIFKQINILK